ncbi:NAD-dependent protein deacetylase [Microlunatus capsulatus]|uniref:protein acetyllysine N-acetyltransferase n=1 Tax=Microlunatus capsulatus TaxID=99117 RepID=A0ABS4Z5S8_9ACTN|nr:NAD-dependent protein deacetylase [Microlunatus capsulatus]MBP2416396.1 NAD-dependent SIR2 family protein deacetylase [Microlunatus capsulatus]
MSVLPDVDAAAAVADLLRGRRWVALTGAGMSTDSGIPDYRGPTSVRATPMQFQEFVGSEEARRRYWARSYLGFRRIGEASPNAGHVALAELEDAGLQGVLTQNVDGLHAAAGSRTVIDLHGRIADVVCLDCGDVSARLDLQQRLAALNPDLDEPPVLEHAELRPDGDAVVEDWTGFVLAGCEGCGGRLKPDVVFFGESVPKPRVEQAYALVDRAEVLVVLGSSLTVMSGLRFVRHQTKAERPTVIVNRGATRGDPLATLKLERGCSETLTGLVDRLCWR